MFRDATLRLTGLYVGILVLICLFFSINLYQVSSRELDASLGRQMMYFENNPQFQNFLGDDYLNVRQSQLGVGRQHLLVELININLLIVLLGGVGSYFLAKRTLRPIAIAHEAQVRFTADASHELRTPIAAMQAEVEVALRDKKLTHQQATDLLKSNLEELAKLSGLAQGLLQLTHQDVPLSTEPVSLPAVVDEAARRVAKAAKQKRISVETAARTDVFVPGDQPSLATLLVTLLDNAIKYSSVGAKISLSARAVGQEAIVKVRDNGPGIKPADLPHIFDRFYRADSGRAKAQADGYGLGLSIAKNITLRHGGTIEATSTLGKGTTFTIKLPLAKL